MEKSYDLIIIGAGVFGLWTARHAVRRGLSVLVAERDNIGAGASGGLLGALMPHIPTGWNEKKQFQFDALAELSHMIETLESETGFTTGYGRIGRLMPLRAERFVPIAETREKAGQENWTQPPHAFTFSPHHDGRFEGWLDADLSRFGYVMDTLAARLRPRDYLKALAASLGPETVQTGLHFDGLDGDGAAVFNGGSIRHKAGALVLAQGYQTFDYLRTAFDLDAGTGVKGQAAHFALPHDPESPVIYDDGVYIVPHDNGTCAVGSTSEKVWTHPTEPDMGEHGFLDKAFALCPPLRDAKSLGRWAGVRPKCHEREPIIGQLFADKPLYIATGGFKVSFGIAHRVTEALVDEITGASSRISLPETFKVEHHLGAARLRTRGETGNEKTSENQDQRQDRA